MIDAPEKIYNWIHTQLSIARFYGGCKYNGHQYYIDMGDPEKPLVRSDVLKAEQKSKAVAGEAAKAEKRQDKTGSPF